MLEDWEDEILNLTFSNISIPDLLKDVELDDVESGASTIGINDDSDEDE